MNTYTDDDKARALAIYEAEGLAEAHARTEIPKNTIRTWALNTGATPGRTTDKTKAATAERWESRRARLADRMGEVIDLAMDSVVENLAEGHTTKAKDAATAMAILVDKAQLITGAATARTETTDLRARAHKVMDELALRRESKAS